jgi:putative ABC transport system permease protein
MLLIAFKSVWARKRRMIGTLLAVLLGVAFLAGTLLLGDTLRANFGQLYSQANGSTSILLRGATKVGTAGGQDIRAGVDASLVERVAKVPGVADAEPYLEGYGQLLGHDGKGIGGNGPPTRAANWVPVPSLNPYRLVAGRAPRADDEVIINRGAATTGHLRLGGTTTLLTPQPVRVVIVGIALLVAAFSIYNTFSILAAQRSRDTALLRALGATRRQVISSSVAETLIIGLAGSLVGLAAGVGIAAGLKGVFGGFGFALPAGGLVFKASSALIAVVAGLLATIIAGALPALRASRVPPLAALRESAAEATAVSRLRIVAGVLLILAGVIGTTSAAVAGNAGLAGAGALSAVAGVVVFGPVAARPAVAVLGSPLTALRGITGNLARQNAMRNPRRTAASASALMVGVAVVSLFTVIGASLKSSAARGVDQSLRADLVVDNGSYGGASGGGGLSPQLATSIARLPAVWLATGLGSGSVLLDGVSRQATIGDPGAIGHVINLGVTAGSLAPATTGTLAVSRTAAGSRHWRVGTTVAVTYPDGASGQLRVGAIYNNAGIAGDYLLTPAGWAPHAGQVVDSQILIKLRASSDTAAARKAITALTAPFGHPRIQDRSQYRNSATRGVNTILGLIYVMLVLAIIIALMGITNTVSLSIHERTRELGLLRSVGQTRAQTRSLIRWESVLIALFGTVGGVILGTFLGWAFVKASATATLAVFSVPITQLLIFLIVGAVAGVVAGLRPARRAARIEVIQALAIE